jgi:hypothetical protein
MTAEERRAENKKYHAKHYAANREKIIAKNKAYYVANREKEAVRRAKYRADNLKNIKAREARYRAANVHKARARNQRHRATLRGHISTLVSSAKQRARKEGLPFALTTADISIPDLCPLLGVKMVRGGPYAPSIDKIIPSLGYVPGNVMVVSWRANTLKGNATLAELQTLAANFAVITALRRVK